MPSTLEVIGILEGLQLVALHLGEAEDEDFLDMIPGYPPPSRPTSVGPVIRSPAWTSR
jgi:hypothetical protein